MANAEKVFVVHGRNAVARDSTFTFLRSIGLKPIEWDQAIALTGKGSPYIGEVLDRAFEEAQAVVVLLTPDDTAYLRSEFASGDHDPETEPRGQARPNVLFEAGMAIGRNEDRTILVEFGDLRGFSDVAGRHAVRLADTVASRKSLAQRLETAGCAVDLTGSDWLEAGDFTIPSAPGGKLPLGRKLETSDRHGPHVDGNWYAGGANHADTAKITNNGAVALFDVTLQVPDALKGHVQLMDAQTVTKLPIGKSFSVKVWTTNRTLQGGAPNQFELLVTAKLEDGASFSQDVYFDAA